MRHDEYARHDATGLAALVASGEVQPRELLALALARLEAVGPTLNPVAVRMDAIAHARLDEPLAGPFAGVPFLLKDWNQHYAGVVSTGGSVARRNWIPDAHSTTTDRFLAAGLVAFGRTTTPELALLATTETRLHGATRNPHDPRRTPGGSSGGAAAAVASGIVPMAGASDGGGSIRIPAGYCGLFGFRPGRGIVPEGPAVGEGWEGANSELVLTRSVRDAATMLDVLAGADPGAPFLLRGPDPAFAEALRRPPGRLRIRFTTASPIGSPVDPESVAAVEGAARLLAGLGHDVGEEAPPIDGAALAASFLDLYCGQVAADVAATRALTGAGLGAFEPRTRALARLGRAMPAGLYVASRRRWNDFARALGRFFGSCDLLMLPTAAGPPPLIGELAPDAMERVSQALLVVPGIAALGRRFGTIEALARDSLARTPFTQLSNLTGTPSMSVPLHRAAVEPGGPLLPFGVQFVGPVGSEARLLSLAAELEQAAPWDAYLSRSCGSAGASTG